MQSNLALQTLANLACPVLIPYLSNALMAQSSIVIAGTFPLAGICHIKQSLNAHLGLESCLACCKCKIPHCQFACFRNQQFHHMYDRKLEFVWVHAQPLMH